jgi:uncharacterized protein (TIGR03083 family)
MVTQVENSCAGRPAGATLDLMEIRDHIESLASDGGLLADAAERASLDASVPSCPGWRVRDLLTHVGYVHRWATGYVVEAHLKWVDRMGEEELLRAGPPDAELTGWFRAGHADLVSALRAADPALRCWTFLDAPSPLAFWARRQAHETAIHRADAQLAAAPGEAVSGYPAALAADGIDELVTGFGGRKPAKLADSPATLVIRAEDGTGPACWTVVMGHPDARAFRGAPPGGDPSAGRYCEVSGLAADLYLALWNRRPADGLDVRGDAEVLATWRDRLHVRWG